MKKNKIKQKVTMAKAFKTIIWPRRNLVFIGLFLILINRLSGFVLPLKSKDLLDDIYPNHDMDSLYDLLWIVGFALLIQAITSFLLTRILSVQAQYLISELRAQVQKKVLSLPISFFDNTKSGAFVSRPVPIKFLTPSTSLIILETNAPDFVLSKKLIGSDKTFF